MKNATYSLLILIAAMLASVHSNAQSKPNIYVLKPIYDARLPQRFTDSLSARLVEYFKNSQEFRYLTAKDLGSSNIDYYVSIKVFDVIGYGNLGSKNNLLPNGSVSVAYTTYLAFSCLFQFIDPITGSLKFSKVIYVDNNVLDKTNNAVVYKNYEEAEAPIFAYIFNDRLKEMGQLPISKQGRIVKITKTNKKGDQAEEIAVSFKKFVPLDRDELIVSYCHKIYTVDNKEFRDFEQIGEVRVRTGKDGTIQLFIKDGGDKIKQMFDAGRELLVEWKIN